MQKPPPTAAEAEEFRKNLRERITGMYQVVLSTELARIPTAQDIFPWKNNEFVPDWILSGDDQPFPGSASHAE
jgi:hypothetical protein